MPRVAEFLGKFQKNIPIALTLMVRLAENVIIVSPIIAPRPQNYPPFKSLYIYIYGYVGGMYRNFVGALQAACSTDCNKIWHKI